MYKVLTGDLSCLLCIRLD